MNQHFITKYTPKNIDNFYIDNDIKIILEHYIELDNINLMFFGDPGTGKSSIITAILNKYYNNKINGDNVIYISNLKDMGFHTVRQMLKNFCKLSTTTKYKKTVVFDDIDIINEQIQQIIRHCIDKYPDKINFIGSCSNIQKVLDNIQSCVNIIKLSHIKNDGLNDILNNVILRENLKIQDDAKDLIIKISYSSVRNLLNYIYKLRLLNEEVITVKTVENICSNISFYKLDEYMGYIFKRESSGGYNILKQFINMGYSVMDIYENLFNYIKISTIILENDKFKIYKILSKYIQIFNSIHEDYFELLLFSNEICKLY